MQNYNQGVYVKRIDNAYLDYICPPGRPVLAAEIGPLAKNSLTAKLKVYT